MDSHQVWRAANHMRESAERMERAAGQMEQVGSRLGYIFEPGYGSSVFTLIDALADAQPVVSTWRFVPNSLPEIIPFDDKTTSGSSAFVLTVCVEEGFEPYCVVQQYRRGGQGDETTHYWSDNDLVAAWMPLPALPEGKQCA